MEMTCSSCVFWVKEKEEDPDGACRRYPPVPFPKAAINPITQQQGIVVLAFWPKIRPELWCGEMVPKTEGGIL
jgi:hypothetical protein